MKVIVVGLGVQGRKRRHVARDDCVATVDPVNPEADFRTIDEVPPDRYEAALLCTPDSIKLDLIGRLLALGKHVLVEKPLLAPEAWIAEAESTARSRGLVIYTAYNHRFEPHFARMLDTVRSGALGRLYRCRMFYGNGTARLVRESGWRDQGTGVFGDIGSHLFDTIAFWFGIMPESWIVVGCDRFENLSPDHVVIAASGATPRIELEMTLLSWRNSFTCDLFAENGSAHIRSLCKWGPSRFILRNRVFPVGRPSEHVVTLEQDDPTWGFEYEHFKKLCMSRSSTALDTDRWIARLVRDLAPQLGRPR